MCNELYLEAHYRTWNISSEGLYHKQKYLSFVMQLVVLGIADYKFSWLIINVAVNLQVVGLYPMNITGV